MRTTKHATCHESSWGCFAFRAPLAFLFFPLLFSLFLFFLSEPSARRTSRVAPRGARLSCLGISRASSFVKYYEFDLDSKRVASVLRTVTFSQSTRRKEKNTEHTTERKKEEEARGRKGRRPDVAGVRLSLVARFGAEERRESEDLGTLISPGFDKREKHPSAFNNTAARSSSSSSGSFFLHLHPPPGGGGRRLELRDLARSQPTSPAAPSLLRHRCRHRRPQHQHQHQHHQRLRSGGGTTAAATSSAARRRRLRRRRRRMRRKRGGRAAARRPDRCARAVKRARGARMSRAAPAVLPEAGLAGAAAWGDEARACRCSPVAPAVACTGNLLAHAHAHAHAVAIATTARGGGGGRRRSRRSPRRECGRRRGRGRGRGGLAAHADVFVVVVTRRGRGHLCKASDLVRRQAEREDIDGLKKTAVHALVEEQRIVQRGVRMLLVALRSHAVLLLLLLLLLL